MSNGLTLGWYAFDFLEDGVSVDSEGCIGHYYSRRIAQVEAEDWFRSHIGYWDGRVWLDVHQCGEHTLSFAETALVTHHRPPHTQRRIDSFCEATTNTIIGLGISQIANFIVIPLVLGISITAAQNLTLAVLFTVISVARQYVLRRVFDGRSPWQALRACFSRVSTLR